MKEFSMMMLALSISIITSGWAIAGSIRNLADAIREQKKENRDAK